MKEMGSTGAALVHPPQTGPLRSKEQAGFALDQAENKSEILQFQLSMAVNS